MLLNAFHCFYSIWAQNSAQSTLWESYKTSGTCWWQILGTFSLDYDIRKSGLSHLSFVWAYCMQISQFTSQWCRIIVPPELGYPGNDFNKSGPRPTTFSVKFKCLRWYFVLWSFYPHDAVLMPSTGSTSLGFCAQEPRAYRQDSTVWYWAP